MGKEQATPLFSNPKDYFLTREIAMCGLGIIARNGSNEFYHHSVTPAFLFDMLAGAPAADYE